MEKYFCPRELREMACIGKSPRSWANGLVEDQRSHRTMKQQRKTTKGSRAVKKKELEATVVCVDEGDGSVATDAQSS